MAERNTEIIMCKCNFIPSGSRNIDALSQTYKQIKNNIQV